VALRSRVDVLGLAWGEFGLYRKVGGWRRDLRFFGSAKFVGCNGIVLLILAISWDTIGILIYSMYTFLIWSEMSFLIYHSHIKSNVPQNGLDKFMIVGEG
jgi:hypothetical protein